MKIFFSENTTKLYEVVLHLKTLAIPLTIKRKSKIIHTVKLRTITQLISNVVMVHNVIITMSDYYTYNYRKIPLPNVSNPEHQ